MFEPVGDMAAKQFEPLRTGHELEIAFQSLVQARAIHAALRHPPRRSRTWLAAS
jgi:hypothetical protein